MERLSTEIAQQMLELARDTGALNLSLEAFGYNAQYEKLSDWTAYRNLPC